jgi:hypothetical protein
MAWNLASVFCEKFSGQSHQLLLIRDRVDEFELVRYGEDKRAWVTAETVLAFDMRVRLRRSTSLSMVGTHTRPLDVVEYE